MSVQGGQRRSMFLIASLALGGVVGGTLGPFRVQSLYRHPIVAMVYLRWNGVKSDGMGSRVLGPL